MAAAPALPLHCIGQLVGHEEGAVMCVRFNADGNYCLTGGQDRLVKLWNPHTQLLIKTYKGHGLDVNDAVATTDNSRFVSCSNDKSVIVWDVATGRIISKFRGHGAQVLSVKFNADCTVVASSSYDASVRLWDLRAQNAYEPIMKLEEAKDSIPTLCVRGCEILTGSVDGFVRNYDIRMGRMRSDCMGEPVTSVTFTHDNNCILVSSLDGTVRLMDKETGELLKEYRGHVNADYKIDSCLSPYDACVLSGSEDGAIYTWDLATAKLVHKLRGPHTSIVCSLSYHPKKPILLSSAVDGSVCVWSNTQPQTQDEE